MKQTNDTALDTLRRLVCEAAGCDAKAPADFYTLISFIESRTRETIGLTTVKRMWQYGGLSSKPRQSTLNVMARSIGYRGYDDFCNHYGDCTPSSDLVLGENVSVSDLTTGQKLMLRWNPGREITAEYLGNNTFRILNSQGSKLSVGDTFQAAFFAIGHAALLANVIHSEHDHSDSSETETENYSSWPLYEIGQQGGLTLIRQL